MTWRCRTKRRRDHLRAELLTGTYMKKNDDKKWGDFCDEYDENVLVNLRPRSRCEILISLRHFTRIMKAKSLQHRKPATVGPFYAPINPPKWVRFARRSPAEIQGFPRNRQQRSATSSRGTPDGSRVGRYRESTEDQIPAGTEEAAALCHAGRLCCHLSIL